jgi:hypothetical protein
LAFDLFPFTGGSWVPWAGDVYRICRPASFWFGHTIAEEPLTVKQYLFARKTFLDFNGAGL